MKWRENKIIKPDTAIYIKDSECTFVLPTVRTITVAEYSKIRPEKRPAVRVDFLFRKAMRIHVDYDLGEFLIRKFPSVYVIESDTGEETILYDDLDKLSHKDLLRLWSKYNKEARKKEIETISMYTKADVKKKYIRKLRKMGIKIDD